MDAAVGTAEPHSRPTAYRVLSLKPPEGTGMTSKKRGVATECIFLPTTVEFTREFTLVVSATVIVQNLMTL